jgi:hypothetical protein
MFLLITRLTAWLRLARREEAWKIAEILLLRHQFAVLQRQQPRRPKLNWADRALIATLLAFPALSTKFPAAQPTSVFSESTETRTEWPDQRIQLSSPTPRQTQGRNRILFSSGTGVDLSLGIRTGKAGV